MNKRYRVGIIGSTKRGDYGHAIDVALANMPEINIVAVADEDDAGRVSAQQRTSAPRAYASYREMLKKEDLDIVAICPRWIDQHHEMLMAAADAGVALQTTQVGGMFGLFFTEAERVVNFAEAGNCDVAAFKRFFHAMLDRGVYLAPSAFEAGFVSSAHSDEHIEATVAAAREAFARL